MRAAQRGHSTPAVSATARCAPHVADENVRTAEQLDRRREREGHVLGKASAESEAQRSRRSG
eukprot:908222-Prymnesium_polylepis.1